MTAPTFTLFVSAVEGHLVTRFGSREYIGARRTDTRASDEVQLQRGKRTVVSTRRPPWSGDTEVTWDLQTIVPIPAREYGQFRREYDRAIRDGSLRRRTQNEWEAQVKAQKQRAAEAKELATVTGG